MRDIYLIDFENVASDGLTGITHLDPEDQVVIFYSTNSNRLTMKMHILIGKSVCKLTYFETAVGGRNALDHQISTYLGYLIGTGGAERNYYIVSRDTGYKYVTSFWAESEQKPSVYCVDSIRTAGRMEQRRQEREAENAGRDAQEQPAALETSQEPHPAQKQEQETRLALRPEQEPRPVQKQEQEPRPVQKQEKDARPAARKQRGGKAQEEGGKKVDISALIAPYPMLQEQHLQQLIADSQKQKLCNHLRKHLGQEKGLALYNEIKRKAWH